jgi:hypothetical protein
MKEIIVVKFFLVLYCNDNNGFRTYEVRSLENPKETGIIATYQKHNINDTIKVEIMEKVFEVKK